MLGDKVDEVMKTMNLHVQPLFVQALPPDPLKMPLESS